MSLPREHYKENLFCEELQQTDMLFDERSKSQEHIDRFSEIAETQKIKKNEEN